MTPHRFARIVLILLAIFGVAVAIGIYQNQRPVNPSVIILHNSEGNTVTVKNGHGHKYHWLGTVGNHSDGTPAADSVQHFRGDMPMGNMVILDGDTLWASSYVEGGEDVSAEWVSDSTAKVNRKPRE